MTETLCQYCGHKVDEGIETCEYCAIQISHQPGSALERFTDLLDEIGAEYTEKPSIYPGEMMPCIAVVFDRGRGNKGCLFEMYFALDGDFLGHGSWRSQK